MGRRNSDLSYPEEAKDKKEYKIHSEVLMGRRPRIEFKGALYNVIQRGNNK